MAIKKFVTAFLLTLTFLFGAETLNVFAQKTDTGESIQNNGEVTLNKGDDDDDGRPQTVDPSRGPVVDDDSRCPGTDFTTIQAAVNASSPGTLIQVCPGNYQEQVVINKRLTIVGVHFQNENQAIIKPAPAAPNTTSLFSGAAIAAIVLVNQTSSVILDNLTIDGSTNGVNGCVGSALVGVFFRNASGTAENLAVKNIRAVGDGSCQNNFGIFAQSGNNGRSRVKVINSSVHDYEKAGIVGNEVGTEVTLIGNAVTGLGPIASNVQNGIQVGFGAKGYVAGNTVLNHINTNCTNPQNCVSSAAGNIIIVEVNDAQVFLNSSSKSQAGIFILGDRAEVSGNTVTDTDALDGISLVGDRNEVRFNRIFNSDRAGVFVSGDQNRVKSNFINEAAAGIFQDSGSSGNSYSRNRFVNTFRQTVNSGNASRSEGDASSSAPGVSAVRF